ncbi:hypothetical protein OJAV_G00006490 [Oryzias javanicus]|uniref:NAD(P)(+)--arginine ADP-ribosyltransferase n=1 Tax=Oryzias javanicus TaxID=123683 RepID=A0A437DML7_ORYJA|nr:hypothetical protein OJAV_G00006490 [Oryzias javanicus]
MWSRVSFLRKGKAITARGTPISPAQQFLVHAYILSLQHFYSLPLSGAQKEDKNVFQGNTASDCLMFTAFNSNTNVLVESVKLLDMSHSVVDDMYEGCRERAMETVIQSGLLKQELDNSEKFQKAWNAKTQCSFMIPGGIKEHTAALSAFYHGDKQFITDVNTQVETMGENLTDFQFKSFHFLLMDALMLLKPQKCKTGFAIVDDLKIPKVGSAVRLAGFTMVETDEELLTDLDDAIFLKINSCFFVNLEESICKKNVAHTIVWCFQGLQPSPLLTCSFL